MTKIPKRVKVFGEWVSVKIQTREQLSGHVQQNVDGLYLSATREILVAGDLSEKAKLETYRHELLHAQFRISGVWALIESHFETEAAARFEESMVDLLTAAGGR